MEKTTRSRLAYAFGLLFQKRRLTPNDVEDYFTSRQVRGVEQVHRLESGAIPTLQVCTHLLNLLGASFGDLGDAMDKLEVEKISGPAPPENTIELVGPALRMMREEKELSPFDLVGRMAGARHRTSIEKILRWEMGDLTPTLTTTIWAVWALDQNLHDLDRALEKCEPLAEIGSARAPEMQKGAQGRPCRDKSNDLWP